MFWRVDNLARHGIILMVDTECIYHGERDEPLIKKAAAIICFAVIISMPLTGCLPKAGAETASVEAMGKYENGVYSNEYFGMTAVIQGGWNVSEGAQMMQDAKTSVLAAPVDDETRKQMQTSIDNTVYLIFANKYPAGFIGTNPSITIAAEYLPYSANIVVKSGADYLKALQNNMARQNAELQFDSIQPETIDTWEFYSIEASLQGQGTVQYRKYYAILYKGYALVINTAWQTDEEKKELDQMVDSIRFA
jgi:hypothetical protein